MNLKRKSTGGRKRALELFFFFACEFRLTAMGFVLPRKLGQMFGHEEPASMAWLGRKGKKPRNPIPESNDTTAMGKPRLLELTPAFHLFFS